MVCIPTTDDLRRDYSAKSSTQAFGHSILPVYDRALMHFPRTSSRDWEAGGVLVGGEQLQRFREEEDRTVGDSYLEMGRGLW